MSREIGPVRLALPVPVASADRERVVEQSDARLIRTIREYAGFEGDGQEMGRNAEGPEVNRRRSAVSAMWARHGDRVEEKLPRRSALSGDLIWIRSAERQPIAVGRPFDFSWSTNPMSTPSVLAELCDQRNTHAMERARAIEADPGRAFDAGDDNVTAHLHLEDGDLRGSILADTLLQLRARRRSSAGAGRIGSLAVVGSFEQRLACACAPEGDRLEERRERALLRFVVAQQCGGSVNALYEARNTVAILADFLGDDVFATDIGKEPGLDVPLYYAIHQRYSGNTPRAVDHYLTELAFTGGEREDRVDLLKGLVEAGTASKLADRRSILRDLQQRFGVRIAGALEARTKEAVEGAIVDYLRAHTELPPLKEGLSDEDVLHTHGLLLSLHRSLMTARPTADELELIDLPWCKSAEPDVAALIHTLRSGDLAAQLEAVGAARRALAGAFLEAEDGFDRQMLVRVDRKIELVSTEILGTALEKIGSDDDALPLCLLAVRSALRGVIAGNLDALRGRAKTAPTEELSDLLAELDRRFASGSIPAEDARSLLGRVFQSATEVADAARIFLRRREAAIHFGALDVELDPYAIDGLIKETPLHYLLGLSERGLGGTSWHAGARALNSVGPRVYRRALVAANVEEMKRWRPTSDDLCVIEAAKEKRLVFGGGLMLDAKDAGPGYSHAAVFAKGHGISAIALPDLARRFTPMFREFGGEQVYVDDRPASFAIKPLSQAIREGLVAPEDVDKLRPGTNRTFSWFDVGEDGRRSLIERHELHPFEGREVKEVELLVPDLTDKLRFAGPISFADLAALPIDRSRQLAGEKGTVLARLHANERLRELGVKVPDGAVIPPFLVADLLRDAGVLERWNEAAKDASADPSRVRAQVEKALSDLLLSNGRPTAAAKKLLRALEQHPALAGRVPWIVRSSFTGEDRPNKSAAGQYDSYPNALSARQRIDAIIGVIGSAWNDEAVNSNREMGIDGARIWPAIVIQPCLDADKSGVAVSRGPNGAFGVVGFQAKRGFGGGVDRDATEEGVLRAGQPIESMLTAHQQETLREAVLAIEMEFDRSIEPGGRHAVDVEWVIAGRQLYVVQARVLSS